MFRVDHSFILSFVAFPLQTTTIQSLSNIVQFQVPSRCDQALVLLPDNLLCSTQWKFLEMLVKSFCSVLENM